MEADKKTIALLIPSLSGGGAERVAANLSIDLEEMGYKVILMCSKYARGDIQYEHSGKIIMLQAEEPHYVGKIGVLQCLAEYQAMICTARRLKQLKQQNHVDVAISFMEYFNFINVLSRGKEKTIVRVCTILSERDDMKEWLVRNKRALQLLYNRADRVVVMSEYAKRDMAENYGIRPHKLVKIYNPLRPQKAGEGGNKHGDVTIIAVGRIHPVKQQHHIIRAFSGIVKDRPEAVLLIIGKIEDRRYYRYLCKLIRELELEGKVILKGHCKNVHLLYKNAKFFVMASRTEGFPNAMLEALQEGLPVLSTDSPGAIRELLTGSKELKDKTDLIEYAKYGILTPAMDGKRHSGREELTREERMFSEAMMRLMSDDEVYSKYFKVMKGKIKYFESKYICSQWEKLF